jgi:hypothetical protein
MFENFGLTKEVFIKEQEAVKELRELRDLMQKELDVLRAQFKQISRYCLIGLFA